MNPYQYFLAKFHNDKGKTQHLLSILKKGQIAITGSSILQIKLGVLWEGSDIDIVAC